MTNIAHENIVKSVLSFVVKQEFGKHLTVLELGKKVVEEYGADKLVNGGIWILDCNKPIEFYSPLFRKNLGYTGEKDFPSVPESWQKAIKPKYINSALPDYHKHIETKGKHPYYLDLVYNTKQGGKIALICSGTALFENNKPTIMIGTHTIKI